MKKIVVPLALLAVLLAPTPLLAAQVITLDTIKRLIENVANFLIIVAGFIIVGFMVYAGLKMVMSQGDTTKFAEGKKMLINAMWGALVVFGVGIIVNTIASFANNPTGIIN